MIFYIVVGLAVVLFILFLVFAAKSWHWSDIVAVSFIFPLTIILVILAAATLRTHDVWRKKHKETVRRLEKVKSEVKKLEHGTARMPDGRIESADESVTSLKEELGRELFDRGRVWRNCVPSERSDNTFTLMTTAWGEESCTGAALSETGDGDPASSQPLPVAEGEAEEEVIVPAGDGRPHNIVKDMVLFAFLEVPLAEIDESIRDAIFAGGKENFQDRLQVCRLPSIYLGEFSVTEAVPDSITLSPTILLSESQLAVINDSPFPWTLIEMMPVDSHRAFEGLSEEQLRALFAESLADDYIRNGKTGDRDQDPPERLMVRVRFLEEYKQIQVDAADDPPSLPSSDFDALGRAVPAWLRHGGEGDNVGFVEFEAGDEAEFDAESVQSLLDQGVCEEIERVYKRPLYDFEYLFHELHRQTNVVADNIRVTRQAIGVFTNANAKSQESVEYRTKEVQQLNEDLTGFENERQKITKYRKDLDQRYHEILGELSELYRTSLLATAQIPAG